MCDASLKPPLISHRSCKFNKHHLLTIDFTKYNISSKFMQNKLNCHQCKSPVFHNLDYPWTWKDRKTHIFCFGGNVFFKLCREAEFAASYFTIYIRSLYTTEVFSSNYPGTQSDSQVTSRSRSMTDVSTQIYHKNLIFIHHRELVLKPAETRREKLIWKVYSTQNSGQTCVKPTCQILLIQSREKWLRWLLNFLYNMSLDYFWFVKTYVEPGFHCCSWRGAHDIDLQLMNILLTII